MGRDVEEQRRADVVRQVADDAQAGAERREVVLERIGNDEAQRVRRKFTGKARREIAVDLDRRDVPGARDERAREGREPGADLDHVVSGLRRHRVDDARDVVRVDEEILAEAAARDVARMRALPVRRSPVSAALVRAHRAIGARACLPARSIASRSAASRLPTSAVAARAASTARSSAVP